MSQKPYAWNGNNPFARLQTQSRSIRTRSFGSEARIARLALRPRTMVRANCLAPGWIPACRIEHMFDILET